jgi:hypothetical protein
VGCERWDAQKALAESSAPALAKLGKPKPKIPPVTKMSRVLLIIYTKRHSEREVKILLERKQKP